MIAIASCGHNCDDERIYHKQINTLISNGYQVQYFAYCNKSYIKNESNKYLECRFLNSTEISQKEYKKLLFNLLNNNPPKIFHIHDMELLPIAFQLKKNYPNIHIIYDVHEDLESMWETFSSYAGVIKKIINYMLSKYEQKYLSCVDQFILANRFANKKKYQKYADCIILENFPLIKNIKKNTEELYQLLYHGQLSEERGIINLIAAFHLLSEKYPNLELLLIGKCRKNNFKDEIITHIGNNKKIKLIDEISHDKIWSYLEKAHIGLIPFTDVPLCKKNTPTKLFEYMLTNCAIVASDLKPIKEFCKNSASWAVPGDIESLAEAIEYYINNKNKYLDHIKMNNDLINSDYNWNIISNKLLNIYNELLN